MNVSTFRFRTYIFQENEETHVKCMHVTFQIDKKTVYEPPLRFDPRIMFVLD